MGGHKEFKVNFIGKAVTAYHFGKPVSYRQICLFIFTSRNWLVKKFNTICSRVRKETRTGTFAGRIM